MARTAFVVFSLALILSMQFVEGKSEEKKNDSKEEVQTGNRAEDKKVIEDETKKYISEGLQDAVNKGLVKDTNEIFDASASPQQEEEFLMKILFQAMAKKTVEGRMDPKVLKEKLFPGGGGQMDPKIKPAIIQLLKDAMSEVKTVQDGTANSPKHAL